jgi:hypothetical protein
MRPSRALGACLLPWHRCGITRQFQDQRVVHAPPVFATFHSCSPGCRDRRSGGNTGSCPDRPPVDAGAAQSAVPGLWWPPEPGPDVRSVEAGPADHLPVGPAYASPTLAVRLGLRLNPSACELSRTSCDRGDRRERSDNHLHPAGRVPPLHAAVTLLPLSHAHLLTEEPRFWACPARLLGQAGPVQR